MHGALAASSVAPSVPTEVSIVAFTVPVTVGVDGGGSTFLAGGTVVSVG